MTRQNSTSNGYSRTICLYWFLSVKRQLRTRRKKMNSLENVFGIDLVELCGPLCTQFWHVVLVFVWYHLLPLLSVLDLELVWTMHQHNTSRFQMQRTQLIRLKILFCEINSSFRHNKQLRFIDWKNDGYSINRLNLSNYSKAISQLLRCSPLFSSIFISIECLEI